MQSGNMIKTISKQEIWDLLKGIPDPEIPVITIADLGILREIEIKENKVVVSITPTYSGCPAMQAIADEIKSILQANRIENPEIKTVFHPVWTTDWLTDDAKERLRKYGIAPPEKTSSNKSLLMTEPKKVYCPRCNSLHTELISQFGSTACKALYRCLDCKEPFDYFKCH
jgi:ring-1,2-phenylacetyl-CoA epoxidase subunit PaaD